MKLTFRALTSNVAVEIAPGVPNAELLQAVVATYRPVAVDDAELRYKLDAHVIWRQNEAIYEFEDPADAVPRFELDLYEQLIARAAPGWLLHAAAVEIDGHAVVFAGPSGAGKTTLALELVRRGHRLISDEIVWIASAREVRGLARPLHVRGSEVPASWRTVPYPLVREASSITIPPAGTFTYEPLPARALVHLTHGPQRNPGCERLPASQALLQLWDRTLRLDDAGLRVATQLFGTVPAYRLVSRTFVQALGLLEDILSAK